MAIDSIPIQIEHDSLKNDLYNAFRKSMTRNSMEDNREGFEKYNESGSLNMNMNENNARVLSEEQQEVIMQLANDMAESIENWVFKQRFQVTKMIAPLKVNELNHVKPIQGAPAAPGAPVMIPVLQLQPIMTDGTAEIGGFTVPGASAAEDDTCVELLISTDTIDPESSFEKPIQKVASTI